MVIDSLKNFIAELGTPRDKASGAQYFLNLLSDQQLANAYRTSWLHRKIVDIPALDATREWRNWNADPEQISALEAEEKRLAVRERVKEWLETSRLYGGAALYIGVEGDDPSIPLRPAQISRGGLSFLNVISKNTISVGPLEDDPLSPNYGKPRWYDANGQRVDPSRLVIGVGNPRPKDYTTDDGWGDSVLQAVYDAVLNADSGMANIGSLIYEAKVDVLKIPNLADWMSNEKNRRLLTERTRLAAMLKGNNGMLVIDKEEEHDSKSFSFANLDKIALLFLQVCSGAADIPATRLLGQAPGGLNSSGESDIRNYYDRIKAMQTLTIEPAISKLDEALIYSALGERPPELFYNWRSLWQPTEKERAENSKIVAESIKLIGETGLIPEDALAASAENTIIEWGVLVGLSQALEEFGELDGTTD